MNKITCFITAGLICLIAGTATAQEPTPTSPASPKLYIGPGIGITYGGIAGIKAEYVFVKHFSAFAGAGYYMSGLGYTFGATAKLLPTRRFSPLIYAMYGSNAAIYVDGVRQYNKIYAGPSAGIGADLKVGRGGNKLFFGIQYGIWHPDFKKDWETVKQHPGIELYNEPIPVGFNFGFNFAIKSSKSSR
ncbi:hypothetical protein [Edaphocola aurantiacus]|uniref:hypothetical protein n=1 Tax=Edaphocola aurantiacus TaxID=2601682 RepID=UPI001C98CFA7|nr:hypothetical protein [Edaphocola aurantiacus]